jgi:tetratricopeptide (TPR) repeat protein
MYTYLWLVNDSAGKESAQTVQAESADLARKVLEGQGFTNLRLQTDEVMDETIKGTLVPNLSASERIKLSRIRKVTLPRICLQAIKDGGILLFVWAVLFFWSWHRERTIGMILYAGAIILTIGGGFFFRVPSYLFRRLNEAREWHEWNEVLNLLDLMARVGKLTNVKLKPADMALYRARAMIGLGHKERAIQEFTRICEPHQARWLFLSHLSALYDLAGESDLSVALLKESASSGPRGSVWIDLGWRLLHRKKDVVGAKEALDQASTVELTEIAQPFLLRSKGILAYFTKDVDLARRQLEEALNIFEKRKTMVFSTSNIAYTKAYLCQVMATRGELERARELYAQAKPFLVAAKEKQLLGDCGAMVGEI